MLLHTVERQQGAKAAMACFFLLGSGILAPWNALITAADYYGAVYPGRHVDRLFTVCYLPPCLALLGVAIRFNSMPARPRILAAYALFTAIMLVLPLVDLLLVGDAEVGPPSALAALLAVVVLVGVLDGLSQGALFGEAAELPPQFTHAVVGGTASSGVVICLLRIATKAALPPDRPGLRRSTACYFGLSGLLCAACCAVYHSVLPRLGVVQHYKRLRAGGATLEMSPAPSIAALEAESAAHTACTLDDDTDEPLVLHHRPLSDGGDGQDSVGGAGQPPQHNHQQQQPDCIAAAADVATHGLIFNSAGAGLEPARKQQLSVRHVWREAWQSVTALFCCYAVTLSLFPGVLAEDLTSELFKSWYPVLLISLFNACDLTGKCVPFGGWAPSQQQLLGAALCRVAFVPAFWAAGKYAGSWVWLMASLTVALGLSNGLLTALVMTLAPSRVEGCEAGLVENILVASLVGGLTTGALLGFVWLA